jgi:hypothetical protein
MLSYFTGKMTLPPLAGQEKVHLKATNMAISHGTLRRWLELGGSRRQKGIHKQAEISANQACQNALAA